jgi:hypothetical protein
MRINGRGTRRLLSIVTLLILVAAACVTTTVVLMARAISARDEMIEQLEPSAKRYADLCSMVRISLRQTDRNLTSENRMMVEAAKLQFQNLALDEFRDVKLCAPKGAVIDPDHFGLFCTKAFRDDVPCMRTIVKLAAIYVR